MLSREETQQAIDGLTVRKRKVLLLVLAGKKDREIANQIDTGLRTVENELQELRQTFKAIDRVTLVANLIQATSSGEQAIDQLERSLQTMPTIPPKTPVEERIASLEERVEQPDWRERR